MTGLTEQQARQQRRQDGENVLAQEKKSNPMKLFLGQFRDVMVLILLVATGVSVLLGEVTDAVTILLIVLLNAILGFVQEFRTEQTLETLRQLTAPSATVCRDGSWLTLPASQLVRGDWVRVEAGDSIPADCAIQEAAGLAVNESVLTGESEAVSKQPGAPEDTSNALHKSNILYAGTAVLRGSATAVVIATGIHTQMGQISTMLQEIETDLTPLQKRLAGLGKVVAAICIGVCIAVFLAGICRGEPAFAMLMTGITIAIAAIPEGLPATVTIALALAVNRMMKQQALVNRLHSVETLGCASVICTDKTGTITENKMTVTQLLAGGIPYQVTGTGYQISGSILQNDRMVNPVSHPALSNLLTCGILCSTAEITAEEEPKARGRGSLKGSGAWTGTGDPTEIALLIAGAKGGLRKAALHRQHPQLAMTPFDSESRYMSVQVQQGAGVCLYAKGAADVILERCAFYQKDSELLPLTASMRQTIQKQVEDWSSQALRVLAFAMKETDQSNSRQMVFLGLAGMLDPPREEARTAIRTCALASIQTVMITGDHKNTAVAIAEKAGLLRGRKAMTGAELDALTDQQLAACIREYGVFARVNPAHKLRLVRAYRKNGAVVAMTGDGVNDAPAIKEADVGVAMGKTGTDVAKQAADVVLLDDNLATLVYAVEQGRCIYANIRKFVRYLLSCNIGEVLTMMLSILMGMPIVLLPTQLLLVNLVTDGLPAIALGMEPPEPEQMRQPPRRQEESFFSNGLLGRILFRGILIGMGTLAAFTSILHLGGTLEAARTGALCTLIVSQLVHVFECKSERKSLFSIPYWNNWKLLGAVAISLAVLLAAVQIPALQLIFDTVRLTKLQWGVSLLCSFAVPIFASFYQIIQKRTKKEQ